MTRDDMIRSFAHCLDRFAAEVAAAEREACAKVCDREAAVESNPVPFDRCAVLIRARGKDDPQT